MEDTDYMKAVKKFSAHLNTRCTVNSDGTLEPSEPSFDASGLNDYIRMLIARERDTAERAFKQGEAYGYHEARRNMPKPLWGDFGFTNGTQKFLVWVGGDYIEAREVKDGNLHVMQSIPKTDVYK